MTAIGDTVYDQDLVDIVLDGLPKDYNSFVMIVFTKLDSIDLTDLDSMLLVQQAQLDKFRQELPIPAVSAYLVLANSNGSSHQGVGRGYNNAGYQGNTTSVVAGAMRVAVVVAEHAVLLLSLSAKSAIALVTLPWIAGLGLMNTMFHRLLLQQLQHLLHRHLLNRHRTLVNLPLQALHLLKPL